MERLLSLIKNNHPQIFKYYIMYTKVFGVIFTLFFKRNHVKIYFCSEVVNWTMKLIIIILSLYIWIRNKENTSLCGALWRAYHVRKILWSESLCLVGIAEEGNRGPAAQEWSKVLFLGGADAVAVSGSHAF